MLLLLLLLLLLLSLLLLRFVLLGLRYWALLPLQQHLLLLLLLWLHALCCSVGRLHALRAVG